MPIIGSTVHFTLYLYFTGGDIAHLAKWNTNLRNAREEMELSLAQAVKLLYECHKIKMNRTELGKIERSEIDCNVTKFKALCDIYSVEPNRILDWKEN